MKERVDMSTFWLAKVKNGGLDQQKASFGSIIGPFSVAYIYRCSLGIIRVWLWRENTLLRVSPLFFLSHHRVFDFVPFYFGFGLILKI